MLQHFRASRPLRGLAAGCETIDGFGNFGLVELAISAWGAFAPCEQLMHASAPGALFGVADVQKCWREGWK